jgi:hypothetical protein
MCLQQLDPVGKPPENSFEGIHPSKNDPASVSEISG